MFQLRSDLAGSLRRKRMPEALAATFTGSPVRAVVDPSTRDVVATPPAGSPTRYSFDQHGFISSITTPKGRTWRLTSDKDGRSTSVTNPGGSTAGFGYDHRGRLAQIFRDNRPLFHLQYDEAGNLVRTLYPDSTTETLFYQNFEQLTAAMRRSGVVQAFEYDDQQSLTAIVDGRGNRTQYHYGHWNSPDRAVYPDGSIETYEYDEEGYLKTFSLGSSQSVSLHKDDKAQIRKLEYSDGVTLIRDFDDSGKMVSAVATREQSERHECHWQYDAEGRVVSERSSAGEDEQAVEYSYNKAGQLCELFYPGGEQVSFAWDEDGRLLKIRDWSGQETRWNYPSAEVGWEVDYPGGLRAGTSVLGTGLTSGIVVQRPSTQETLFSLAYRYDAEDRVALCVDSMLGQRQFSYDADGRLLRAGTERFAYDPADNLTTTSEGSADYNAANQPTATGAEACLHDDRGNLIQGPGPGGIWHFEWDARNRLVRANGPNWQTVTYGYDALGRRCWRREEDSETRYIWAGEALIAEVERHNGQVVGRQEYLFIPGTGTLFAIRINGRVLYAHCDHLGSPRLLTDAQGNAAWAATLSAWGSLAKTEGENLHQPWRFPGQYADETTGLHENRFRTYSPFLGRYLSRDPLGYVGGLNLYAYASNDPVNRADPLGLWGWPSWKTVVTVVAAVAVGVAVVALAPVALPAAIILAGAAAGAVGFGLNEALNQKEFCATCIALEALKGAAVGAVAALPFAFLPATAGVAAFAGAGGLSGAINYAGSILTHPGTPWSWSGLAWSVGIGAVTAGVGRYVAPRITEWWSSRNTPAEPRPGSNLIREDDHMFSSEGRQPGSVKSHITEDGDLSPANPDGEATIQQHIRGSEPAKSDSPYTSFKPEDNTGKSYGNERIVLDKDRLQADINSGKVKDVEIVNQDQIQQELQQKIDDAQARYDANPSAKNLKRLNDAQKDLANTTRDQEVLIKGVVPKDYITVPSTNAAEPAGTPAVGPATVGAESGQDGPGGEE